MKKLFPLFLVIIPFFFSAFQDNVDTDLDTAFNNARKGVYWALSNVPENKLHLNHELISGNKLIAVVKLDIEINGIKVNSTGYSNSTEVSVKLYRSIDSLKNAGYLKNKRIKQPREE